MKDLFRLKREFLEYCEIEKGQSLLTIENYDRYLSRFLTWLKTEKTQNSIRQPAGKSQNKGSALQTTDYRLRTSDIDQEIIRKYRLYINRLQGADGRELKATTQNHHILALRAFLRYLSFSGEKVISPEKLTLAKTGDREVSFLNKEEYLRLLDAPNTANLNGLRDKSMLELLFSTGLRVSELCGLKLGQMNFDKGEIAVLGKGKKLRVVFLSDVTLKYLADYLVNRKVLKIIADDSSSQLQYFISETYKDDPVFLSNRKNPIKPRAVERLVQKYAKVAGITKTVTPHTLRHTFATDLLGAGADIRSVQSLLGHSNISTTQVYTHVTDKHLREIHQKFHDRSRIEVDEEQKNSG
ncbi:MAG: tyrosine-type recombinase/integrase [Patescibacteria group bacterium]